MENKIKVIKAMLNDNEFLCGGIFQKEEYYMKKYNLTEEEIINMQARLHWALRPDQIVEKSNVNVRY